MPFESISIHETYELITPIGSLWRKIEATYKIDPSSEDEYIARDKVKNFLDESHKKYFPELPPPLHKVDPKAARMKMLIDSATTKAQLVLYEPQCPAELKEHYQAKLKQLKK